MSDALDYFVAGAKDFAQDIKNSYNYATDSNALRPKGPSMENRNAVIRSEMPKGNREPGDTSRQQKMDSQGRDSEYISDTVPRRDE